MSLSSRQNRKKKNGALKVAALILAVGLLASATYFVFGSDYFRVREVVFHGNKYLSDGRLKMLAAGSSSDNLLVLSSGRLAGNLLASPWIKAVSIRKELPGRLLIKIDEAVPEALLRKKEALFLLDGKGNMLERLGGQSVPFLPVIVNGTDAAPDDLLEAISLARTLRELGLTGGKNSVEITGAEGGRENLAVNMDGLVVKVGEGRYEEKFARLFELSGEIRKRGIPVDYVDLRFANRVIVKPVAEVLK